MKTTILRIFDSVSGQEFREELPKRPVVHLGSAAGCDLVIPCRTDHALTVIRRGARLSVLNRTSTSISCGQLSVGPMRQVEWSVGEQVAIEGVSLRLEISCSANAWKPNATVVNADEAVSPAIPQVSAGADVPVQRTGALLTIVVCCVLLVLQVSQLRQRHSVGKNSQIPELWREQVTAVQALTAEESATVEVRNRMQYLHQQLTRIHLAVVSDGRLPVESLQQDALLFCRSLMAESPDEQERQIGREVSRLLATF